MTDYSSAAASYMEAMQSRIRYAKSLDALWKLLSDCYQRSVTQGSELEEFAQTFHGDRYRRPVAPTMERIKEIQQANAGQSIVSAHCAAWNELNADAERYFQGKVVAHPAGPASDPYAESALIGAVAHNLTHQPDIPPAERDEPVEDIF